MLGVSARELASGARTEIRLRPSTGLARTDVRRLAAPTGR